MSSVLNWIDFYKSGHRTQYPEGTELVYSNLTARSARYSPIPYEMGLADGTIFFGLQYAINRIDRGFEQFFGASESVVVSEYQRRMDSALGPGVVAVDHIRDLHKLGHLPIAINALPEGTLCPIGVPMLTIRNTHKDFFWITNYLESVLSAFLWKPITSATIAFNYRRFLDRLARETGGPAAFVPWQGHDFSFRGMSGLEDAALSGAGHLLSFTGTDTVPAIDFLEEYYDGRQYNGIIGGSVPASEHSVMSMGSKEAEIDTFRRFITKLYPKGIVSIVSDTWDFWKVISIYTQTLKSDILARDGKVVFRPDSGDPVKIICGDPASEPLTPQSWGAVQTLWNVFGGKVNEKGFKELDPHVGLIYGDSITPERCVAICNGLKQLGFASTNIVFGIGSYTYQHVTRDTFGMAVKSTYGVVNGQPRAIFKDPATDTDSIKKSKIGLLRVTRENGKLVCYDKQTEIQPDDELKLVYEDGHLYEYNSLNNIRARINDELKKYA